MRARYKPVNPDKIIRDLRKDFKQLTTKDEPGPERAAELASFARRAHTERQLNMVMHAAQLCLEDDPDAPALLIAAYERDESVDTEDRLRSLVDLRDVGRYVDAPEVTAHAQRTIDALARTWVREGDEVERRHRLRTLGSMFSREFADGIRDELEFLS